MDLSKRLAALERAQVEHLQSDARQRVATLSKAECDLLQGLLAGQSPGVQASALSLSVAEVKQSIEVVLEKIGAGTRADAVRIAIYAGLSEIDERE